MMKRFTTIVVLCLFAAPGMLFSQDNRSDTNWIKQSSGTTDNLHRVKFIEPSTGWIAGDRTIRYTLDAGTSWQLTDTLDGYNNLITGFTATGMNNLWRTRRMDTVIDTIFKTMGLIDHSPDGGYTWDEQFVTEEYLFTQIHFIDSLNGIVIGTQGVIYRTANGGEVWTKLDNSGELLRAIFFLDDNTGWIVGDNSTILHTSNGGFDWTPLVIPEYASLSSVFFIDELNGWVGGNVGRLFSTTDGGVNWKLHQFETEDYFYDLYFKSFNIGWAASAGGRLRYVTDGDTLWHLDTISESNLYDIEFIGENMAWIVGSDGAIFKTINGGGEVNIEENYQPEQLNTLVFPNPFTNILSCTIETPDQTYAGINLYNITGQLIREVKISLQKGTNQIDLSSRMGKLHELEPGNYILSIATINTRTTHKLIKTY